MKINEIITVLAIFLMGVCVGALYITEVKHSTEAGTIELVTNAEKIDSYNAGFRAGAMDILNQLVECEGYSDEVTLMYYSTAIDTLRGLGELDDSLYPCYE